MTTEPQPRSGPTEDRPATRRLQLRVRLDDLGRPGADAALHLVAELYELRGAKWTRLTCRTGPATLEEALQGEGWIQGVRYLMHFRDLPPGILDLEGEKPSP